MNTIRREAVSLPLFCLLGIVLLFLSPACYGLGVERSTVAESLVSSPDIDVRNIIWLDERNGAADIYLYDAATEEEEQLTSDSQAQLSGKISGNLVVYSDLRNGSSNEDVFVYNISTGVEQVIVSRPGRQRAPDISGQRIVWQDNRNGNEDIYLYDLSAQEEIRITTSSANQTAPSIDGDIIVWQDDRNGDWDIYSYDINSGVETRITTDSADQTNPVISGNRIVWEDARSGNLDIYGYDLESETEAGIATGSDDQFNPDVDGDLVVWNEGIDTDNQAVYIRDLERSRTILLSSGSNKRSAPAISGNRVVWGEDGFRIILAYASTANETEVSGRLAQNTTWTTASSPYLVNGDVIVPANITLTIQPGVVVKFAGGDDLAYGEDTSRSELTIEGQLSASGESLNRITFTSAADEPGKSDWYEIHFSAGVDDESVLENCIVEYSVIGVRVQNANPVIRNNEIRYHSYRGILLESTDTDLLVQSNTIEECGIGIEVSNGSPDVENNTITNSTGAGMRITLSSPGVFGNMISGNNIGIEMSGDFFSPSSPLIRDNLIFDNDKSGIKVQTSCNPMILNNKIYNNAPNIAISPDGEGSAASPEISYNQLTNVPFNTEDIVLEVEIGHSAKITAENNWWGTTDADEIEAIILDRSDSNARGDVDYVPFLSDANTEAPVIEHTPVESADEKTDIVIQAVVTDDILVESVLLYYWPEEATEYVEVTMEASGNNYSATIPADVVAGETLAYYIYASDGTNTTTFPRRNAESNPQIIDIITDPPPTISHSRVTEFDSEGEEALVLSADVEDNNQVESVTLYYKQGGAAEYTALDMPLVSVEENTYEATVPAEDLSARGIAYYIEASDGNSASTVPSNEPEENPYGISVRATNTLDDLPSGKWTIISAALEPDPSDIPSVIEDDLGTLDRSVWRLVAHFRDTSSGNDNVGFKYFEYGLDSEITDIEVNRAYWMIQKDAKPVTFTGYGVDPSKKAVFQLTIGTNLVANPYSFPVRFEDLEFSFLGEDVTLAEAQHRRWARDKIWYWDGTETRFHILGVGDDYIIEPGGGFWMRALENGSVVFPNEEALEVNSGENPYDFLVRLSAFAGSLKRTQVYIGASSEASDVYDRLDVEAAPTPPDNDPFIEISIPHTEYELSNDARTYWQDIRSSSVLDREREDMVFTFVVTTDTNADRITLNWDEEVPVPAEYNMVLIDGQADLYIDMREKSSHSYVTSLSRTFQIVISERDDIIKPRRLLLEEVINYPNPVLEDRTTFSYELTKPATVKLEVFDISGVLVRRVIDNEPRSAGLNQSDTWDLHNGQGVMVGSGVYLYKLEARGEEGEKAVKYGKLAVVR